MGKGGPVTKTVKASEARQQWSGLLNEVFKGETRVVVEKSGIPVAAIISVDDLQELVRKEKERAERFKALDATREAFKDVPDEELEREITKAIASVRRKNRERQSRPVETSAPL